LTQDTRQPCSAYRSSPKIKNNIPPSLKSSTSLKSLKHNLRTYTDGPRFTPAPVSCELRLFIPVTQTEVIEMVQALPDKQCLSDPLLTWLLKKSVNVLAPFLCWLFCWSLGHGVVPSSMKSAYITPILKKADLDSLDPKSYRPISNLSVLSKLLERLVSKQLTTYLMEVICFQISSQLIGLITRRRLLFSRSCQISY